MCVNGVEPGIWSMKYSGKLKRKSKFTTMFQTLGNPVNVTGTAAAKKW